MMVKSRDVEVGQRLLTHLANGTSDSAEGIVQLPVSNYLDPERWDREVQNIFKRLPLMLAFSVELKQAGSYKAIDVVGVPVLLIRGRDGVLLETRMRCCSGTCR